MSERSSGGRTAQGFESLGLEGRRRARGGLADDFQQSFGELEVPLLVAEQRLDLGLHGRVGDLLGQAGIGLLGLLGLVHQFLDEIAEHGLLKHDESLRSDR